MRTLIDHVLTVPGVLVYVLVGVIVFAEDALFVGFVVPARPPPCSAASPPAEAT